MPENAPGPDRPAMPEGYGIEKGTDGLLSWSEVVERLTASRNYWVCTARRDGRPHAMPVWGVWLDGAFYFSSDPASVKGRNLTRRPDASVHLESGDDAVIIEGAVERLAGAEGLADFVDAYDAKYGIRVDTGDPAFGIYVLSPEVIFAWRERDFPHSATRWRFDAARP